MATTEPCADLERHAPTIVLADGYARLPEHFYSRLGAAAASAPRLIGFNHALAEQLELGVAGWREADLAAVFSGNRPPRGSQPVALAYAGHQFGHFVPQLGDGRALLLGETVDRHGSRRELQLKGSGPTPWSRGGDGRAALGPVLREYLVSEAMHAFGIPSTRALAAVSTGDIVLRERPLPGAVLTRVAGSHVRVGTFQYFAARGDLEAVRTLADWVIERLYPDARAAASPYLALLDAVIEAQARLVAQWLAVGFIHGVMNTDNMAVSGETIDYGPCAFLDHYQAEAVFSSIDRRGRYAYANQPPVAQWNLARFAETLLPLLHSDRASAVAVAEEALSSFAPRFEAHWLARMRAKLGLDTAEAEDGGLVERLLELMQRHQADFTVTFRRLAHAAAGGGMPREPFADDPSFGEWWSAWQARLARERRSPEERCARMLRTNPWLIPRNHRIEQAIAAAEKGDYAPFEALRAALAQPFDEVVAAAALAEPPRPEERVLATFCGT